MLNSSPEAAGNIKMWRQLASPLPLPAYHNTSQPAAILLNSTRLAEFAILIFGWQRQLMFFNYANKGINLLPE